MGLEFRTEIRPTQTLSPRLQRAVQLLQMSSLDFAALVRQKLGDNPFLESEDDNAPGETDAVESDPSVEDPAALEAAEPLAAANDPWDDGVRRDGSDDRDMWMQEAISGTRGASEGEVSAMEMTACDTTLAMHLHGQLNVMALSERDLCLTRAIVESLDDDGYLRTPLEEIAAMVPCDPPASSQDMLVALRLVQSLEPTGVAARGVGECLALQVQQIEDPRCRELAECIVRDHLDALAARDVPALAAALRVPAARVEAVVDRIRHLDPRPGWRVGASRIDYIVPDVIVRRQRGQWTVQLNPAVVPRVRLNQVYADLFQRHRSRQNGELGEQLQDARWTLRNVEQRFSTILDVAQAIVRRQRHFLEFGPMAMKPLVLREIAEEVGVHESTVSRVTNNKHMATPLGVFELKYFFSRPMVSAAGNACSGTAIRGLIGDIIQTENPSRPMSDAEITRQLADQGLVVARRTVTKYRQLLRIEPVDKRRRHA
ncbi:MAG: RNA polymerase factor sigma-54 [Hydrogenophaga sp.]|uniref:RNA polymerase factor sigma-54 n=1 Tax=Hydrogenophaga sp. TaxID=1904254 RepID=UPI0016BA95FE|nr:RNA polymerase factor sigma-54 [Hydrogenophaga sp.]NIM41116.1 RNA polymerase factor sigma-54 [Hydrogenophaga sp.]NIN26432.1 RNA polymerase factor sigma-54 [Hydrogenophaga sp.]NIN31307.1 RNA polymerase factor sigma-54 [Hydrogenophaga sp.]NIN55362.1 RNA polymerase factor sigma-54 [Hydrogenophaga sp.]NIO51697.1 RNA polymerase factor sigma-54 [Hydrogenophaga sp.]